MPRAVLLLLLLLCGCKDRTSSDFEQAWNTFRPQHVSGAEAP